MRWLVQLLKLFNWFSKVKVMRLAIFLCVHIFNWLACACTLNVSWLQIYFVCVNWWEMTVVDWYLWFCFLSSLHRARCKCLEDFLLMWLIALTCSTRKIQNKKTKNLITWIIDFQPCFKWMSNGVLFVSWFFSIIKANLVKNVIFIVLF